MKKPILTIEILKKEAIAFSNSESAHSEPTLYGVDNGKGIGTYLDWKFQTYLSQRYDHERGNAASGIDLPALNVDIKTTSIAKPQSSSPFRSMSQRVYGLGYSLLIFVYDKTDDPTMKTANLKILHTIFVEKHRTADFQLTKGIRRILDNDPHVDDLTAFIFESNPFLDEGEAARIAQEVIKTCPEQGYVTISPAFQWRLAFGRIVAMADQVDGIQKLV